MASAPFVVFGIDRRSWWRGLAVRIASLAMLPMWPNWITAITNIRGDDWDAQRLRRGLHPHPDPGVHGFS